MTIGVAKTPSARPPSAGFAQSGTLARCGVPLHRAERPEEDARDERDDDRQERVERQVRGDERVRGAWAKSVDSPKNEMNTE